MKVMCIVHVLISSCIMYHDYSRRYMIKNSYLFKRNQLIEITKQNMIRRKKLSTNTKDTFLIIFLIIFLLSNIIKTNLCNIYVFSILND